MNAIDILGLNIEVKDWHHINELPMYIANDFEIKKANINNINCIMLIPKYELPNITQLKKQFATVRDVDNLPIFLSLDKLTTFRRDNLLLNNIPFIYKKNLVYLPFLGTVLTNKKLDSMNQELKFKPSTQLLFIWILYNRENNYFIMDALKVLPFSSMTLSRAYHQLIDTHLFAGNKDGRKIYLTTDYTKKELLEKAKQYFISPIINVGYIEKETCDKKLIESGETALSRYTMINPPTLQTYALEKNNKKLIELQNELIDLKKQIKVEIWDYNPIIFSNDKKSIDPISLYISLMNNKDERIEMALDEILMQNWEEYNDWYR